jgi:hypothetical protein
MNLHPNNSGEFLRFCLVVFTQDLRKMCSGHVKYVSVFLYHFRSKHFSSLQIFSDLSSSWTETGVGLHVQCPPSLSDFNQNCNVPTTHSAGLPLGIPRHRQTDSATRSNRPGLSKSPASNTDGPYHKRALVSCINRQEGTYEQPLRSCLLGLWRDHSEELTNINGRPLRGK